MIDPFSTAIGACAGIAITCASLCPVLVRIKRTVAAASAQMDRIRGNAQFLLDSNESLRIEVDTLATHNLRLSDDLTAARRDAQEKAGQVNALTASLARFDGSRRVRGERGRFGRKVA